MILALNHITKAFLEDVVIRDATFHIEDRQKAALVGNNGAGKTTLFRIITSAIDPDSGEVIFGKDKSMGYLSQHTELESDRSMFDEVMSVRQDLLNLETGMRELEHEIAKAEGDALNALVRRHSALQEQFDQENGYALESEVTGVLRGLGFTEKEFFLPVSALSGGEKTRIALGKLLLLAPDLLLLDEPTNHLDINATSWLEGYLSSYPGAVFIISHDRYFLDKLVTKVIDLTQGVCYSYNGNYTDFTRKKKAIWEAKLREYEKQQREIRRQEEIIERFRRYNTEDYYVKAKSREKLLSHMERLEKPTEEDNEMKLRLVPNMLSGNDVLSIRGLGKSFDGRVLFENADIEIRRGERVAIIGDNGTGKSTLLKLIMGKEEPDSGEIEAGAKVFIGYFDQEHQTLSPEKTLFNEISDEYPLMNNTAIRNMLAAFLFTGDDVFKLVGDLSGGEQGRLSLAKIMLSDVNFLILDEPTNHLDMTSKEILENALVSYEGTLLFVSHDRYFINATATRIIELYHQKFLSYPGNYDYYLEIRDRMHALADRDRAQDETNKRDGRELFLQKKAEEARKRKSENEIRRLEDEIASLEEEIRLTDDQISLPENATDSKKLTELSEHQKALSELLDQKYLLWEQLI